MTKSATLNIRITPDLLAELQELAASRPGTVAEHVRYAVRLYLDVNALEKRAPVPTTPGPEWLEDF